MLYKFILLLIISLFSVNAGENTYNIYNASSNYNLVGTVDWQTIANESTYDFRSNASPSYIPPGPSGFAATRDGKVKGMYYNYYPNACSADNEDGCLYAGGGMFGDDLASGDKSATYVWGATDDDQWEAWGVDTEDGATDLATALNEILTCDNTQSYDPTCDCPGFDGGCTNDLDYLLCWWNCAVGQYGDAGEGEDAFFESASDGGHPWLKIRNLGKKKTAKLWVRKKSEKKSAKIEQPKSKKHQSQDKKPAKITSSEAPLSLVTAAEDKTKAIK